MSRRVDTEAPRCMWCDRRFPNWGELAPHEREHWVAEQAAREQQKESANADQ